MPLDNLLTRFPNGVNDALAEPLQNFKGLSPFKYQQYEDDFNFFIPTQWTITETQAGATQAIQNNRSGGFLELINTAADDDLNAIQQPAATFRLDTARDFFFATTLELPDVLQCDAIAGLYVLDTSPLASLPSDGIFFHKIDGIATLDFHLRAGGTSTSVTVATLANGVMVQLAAVYQALAQRWTIYVNNAAVAQIATLTNMPTVPALALGIALQNGEAVAKTLRSDWIFAARERNAALASA